MITHYIKTIIFYKFENEFYSISIHILFELLYASILTRAYTTKLLSNVTIGIFNLLLVCIFMKNNDWRKSQGSLQFSK